MLSIKKTGMVASLFFLASCASVPEIGLKYYLPQTDVNFKVIKSVTCNESDTYIFAVTPLIETKSYTDYSENGLTIPISKLGGNFSNTTVAVNWYDDGRLKGINSKSTGVGGEIVEGVTSTLLKLSDPSMGLRGSSCGMINKEESKTASFTYTYPKLNSQTISSYSERVLSFKLTDSSKVYRDKLGLSESDLPNTLSGQFTLSSFQLISDHNPKNLTDFVAVKLKKPQRVSLVINHAGSETKPIGQTIAGIGSYNAYIPKAAAFGNSEFSLALSEAGSIQSISYGKESGTASLVGAGNAFLSVFEPESDADLALRYKNQADVIAQHQRVLRCKADPKNCT